MTQLVTHADVRTGIRELGLAGQPVCVHSSLRSFGRVQGGAEAVIDAFLADGCTLMAPAFTESFFAIAPPPELRPARNGWDYDQPFVPSSSTIERIYSPNTTLIDTDMGAIPAALVRRSGRERGNHPLDSFAALGPHAAELIRDQAPIDVYAPFRALAALGGFVLLIGVGLTRMTILHRAEEVAGRTLFRRWANDPDGWPMMVATGGCSEGFDAFEPVIGRLARSTRVGASRWRAFPAGPTIVAAAAIIRADPAITRCRNPDCERCADAVLGGPAIGDAGRGMRGRH